MIDFDLVTIVISTGCCFTYNAGRAPLLEVRHLSVPGTVLGAFLANPEGLSAKMIFTVQLIRVVIIISVSEQVHSRSSDTINLFYELKGTTALYLHTDFFYVQLLALKLPHSKCTSTNGRGLSDVLPMFYYHEEKGSCTRTSKCEVI